MNSQLQVVANDDTIQYKVYVSKAVPIAAVNVTAEIEALVNSRESNESLNTRVFAALNDFIPVPWEIAAQERYSATPGYERVRIRALSKVGLDQHNSLTERARAANREGLEFGNIRVDRTLPSAQVNQIMKDLWFDAVSKVTEHIRDFNKASERNWRIGNITLGIPDNGAGHRLSKGGYREEVDGMLGELIESGLDGAEKISLIANVTLKSRQD